MALGAGWWPHLHRTNKGKCKVRRPTHMALRRKDLPVADGETGLSRSEPQAWCSWSREQAPATGEAASAPLPFPSIKMNHSFAWAFEQIPWAKSLGSRRAGEVREAWDGEARRRHIDWSAILAQTHLGWWCWHQEGPQRQVTELLPSGSSLHSKCFQIWSRFPKILFYLSPGWGLAKSNSTSGQMLKSLNQWHFPIPARQPSASTPATPGPTWALL